jgi:lipopolysaccharide transport system ATP-binding protein
MSSDIAIRVNSLSKCYQIYAKPQDRLKQAIWGKRRKYFTEFWALQNVSFKIRKGECFGILGRNGAGKSTLLQIIAGTVQSTSGSFELEGRVAALLELGSGFDPECTGRENVYLNAKILGLSDREIEAKFDDIVAFSEIGDHLDQPVKAYSSGMLVRLAFATAIHVDPEILIVDEALAVGDFAFQHKCMAKIKQIISSGVTVIFVTHDVGAVMANCQRALLLRNGVVHAIGSAAEVCDRYLETAAAGYGDNAKTQDMGKVHELGQTDPEPQPPRSYVPKPNLQPITPTQRWGKGQIQIVAWSLADISGKPTNAFRFGEKMILTMVLRANTRIPACFPGFMLRDRNGYHLTGITSRTCGKEISNVAPGEQVMLEFEIVLLYRADNYSVLLNVATDEYGSDFYDLCENAGNFTILDEGSTRPPWGYGRTYLPTSLQVQRISEAELNLNAANN